MDIINSQNLTHFDGYYHRFMAVGDYTWGVINKQGYTIRVQPAGGGNPTQKLIELEFRAGAHVLSVPDDQHVVVRVGDHILWHLATPDPDVPPYSIVGDNGQQGAARDAFSSRALAAEDAFSHLFMSAGNYQYQVSAAAGVQQGTISVQAPSPGAGTALITLDQGRRPAPDPATRPDGSPIYAGDTVLWDVHSGSGLVIKTL